MATFVIRVFVEGERNAFNLDEHESRDLPRSTDMVTAFYGAYTLIAPAWRVWHTCYPVGQHIQKAASPVVDVYLQGADAKDFLTFWISAQRMREELRMRNVTGLKTVDMGE